MTSDLMCFKKTQIAMRKREIFAQPIPPSTGVLLCIVFLLVAISASSMAAEKKGEFILTCLDIPDIKRGAGLALVLQLPSGKTCLYDTGSGYPDATSPDGWQAGFNAGRDIVLPFLQKNGIKEIDTVFISHAHYDHFGGLLWLKDHITIHRLIDLTLCSVFARYAKGLSARKIFAAVDSKVLVTGLNGWIQVTCDGTDFTVATERADPPAKQPCY